VKDLSTDTFPLAGNQLIEASAGTGKTYTITNLYIRLLLGHGRTAPLPVNRILVLTFTIAATEELKHRVRQRIVEARRVFAGQGEDPFLLQLYNESEHRDRDLKLLTAASQMMDEAAIFTIHGFCARVLSELSFETGVLFDQNLNADRDAMLQTAAEDCFRKCILELPLLERQVALKLWSNPVQLIQTTKPYLFREHLQFEPAEKDLSAEYAGIETRIRTIQQRWPAEGLPEIIDSAGFARNRKVISRIDVMTNLCREPEIIELTDEVWTVYNRQSMQAALKKGFSLPEHEVLDLIEEVWSLMYVAEQIQVNLWHLVTQSLRNEIRGLKTTTSELTLDDLLSQLARALAANPDLAEELSTRWPIAMIDEFQDTDDLQYGIFSSIYTPTTGTPDSTGNCLLFIGDPKQAIYQFRGADIYTYINARTQANSAYSLAVNWRATAPLVGAINFLFSQQHVFAGSAIDYIENQASPVAHESTISISGKPATPCRISLVQKDKRLTKPQARALCMAHAGEQIVELLQLADDNQALINGEPINAGQIALLVRDKNDARAAQSALSLRGIRSVYVTLESVFLQDTAEDLRLILEAVIDPTNDRAVKAALATSLIRSTAQEIDEINREVVKHQQVLTEFQFYHDLWASRDVAPMIEAIIVRRRLAEKWLHRQGGERQMTNLRHLAELLQQRSSIAPGMHRLLKWFTREKIAAETVASEDQQLRLESDENLVKIVTMHAAKGLEYDIVMVPMAGFIAQQRTGEPALFHDIEDDIYTTHLSFLPDEELQETAQQEKYEEDMRLLYVAITRARYMCFLGVPDTSELSDSAVGRLLQLSPKENRTVAHLRGLLPADLFEVELIDAAATTVREDILDTSELVAPPKVPQTSDHWRVHSYTGVSRRLKKQDEIADSFTVAGYGDDDQTVDADAPMPALSRFSFPRGPRIGVALHSLLEDLDFAATTEDTRDCCDRYLKRMGITSQEGEWLNVLTSWMTDVLQTPLPCNDGTFTLQDIDSADRINELEFHFPVDMSVGCLEFIQEQGYLDHVLTDQGMAVTGIMTGLIDLIVRREGRYYLIDYKSNHLGDSFSAYGPDLLADAITSHHYDLQYLIYSVALHRFLNSRIPDYDYDSCFGGVIYLFLRGMSGASPSETTHTGIFCDSPSRELIVELDKLLATEA
jgi:exodeoxyribonuclease V beta subunit